MSDAQKDILKLLADKVITVDEAERLLKAVNEGEHKKDESKTKSGGPHHHHMGPPHIFTEIFDSLGNAFAEIGPMVKQSVDDVMNGVMGDEFSDLDEEELEAVELENGTFSIKAGTRMVILNDWKGSCGKTDLRIRGVAGDICKIAESGSKPMTIRKNAAHVVVQWSDGPLTIELPNTVDHLKVRMKGGNIVIDQATCDLNLRTLGGNLELAEIMHDLQAKTMGGNIMLGLASSWQGEGRAHTMGGHIQMTIPADVAVKIKADTMGGTVKAAESIKTLENKQAFPGTQKVKLQAGEGPTDAHFALKTMGGDIDIRRA